MKCILQVVQAVFLMLICSTWLWGQTLETRPAETTSQPFNSVPLAAPVSSIPLIVPPGTPLKVALDSEVRVREVGQAIHGKTTEAVYAFDKLLIPAGDARQRKNLGDRWCACEDLGDGCDGWEFFPGAACSCAVQ